MKKASSSSTLKKAILVVGSGYAALKVSQDLAQSGLPLVWVTKSPHFLELPGGQKSFTEWPADLNFQFRPLYLRITRNPLVTALTHARIASIKKDKDGFRIVAVQAPSYVDYDLCTGCGRCMDVCPLQNSVHPPLTRTPAYCPSRALELDKRPAPPCRDACPLGVNVQAYMALTAESRFAEALDVIRRDNPLPGICGRVCHHPCEEACRRTDVDEPLAICSVKRFLADWELKDQTPRFPDSKNKKRPEKVAIVGSGPAGLTAAHYLNQEGFSVTIFEAHQEAGGMLRIGINAFRLPRNILDAEINALVESGIEIQTDTPIQKIDDLLAKGFQAVILCTGAHQDLRLNIPGEDSQGIVGAVEMLRQVNSGTYPQVAGNVLVIGGGNSAIDAARAAVRLGAESVTICYRRESGDMPARLSEIREAEEEGVKIEFRLAPKRVVRENGKVKGLELIRMKMGKPDESGRRRPEPIAGSQFIRPADWIFVAIGQQPHWEKAGLRGHLTADSAGRVMTKDDLSTTHAGVFAAGDVVTGPATVVGSMAQGRQAALQVSAFLSGTKVVKKQTTDAKSRETDYLDIPTDTPHLTRPEMGKRDASVRRCDFEEVETGFTAEQAVDEAKRCLQCASCCECLACEAVCGEIGAIDHSRKGRRITFESPAIIVANESEITPKDLLNQENVYRTGNFKRATDIVNVLIAGSASAGLAMAACADLRTPVAISDIKPQPDYDDDRIGLFICTCNGTMAPAAALDRLLAMGEKMPGVVHSELIFSACHTRGAEMIAKAVKKERLGRVILASCVCCPLDFQCISCNDQRNRARIHLFDELGLDRGRFEMINLRDHLGAYDLPEDRIVEKATSFIREAYIRSRFLTPLRSGTSKIGNRILILGGSDVGLSCAQNLDLQGFKVRLVHKCRLKDGAPLPKNIAVRPTKNIIGNRIDQIPEATIEGIHGNLGNFQTTLYENGKRRQWKSDIVCLADLNILPLAMPTGMFGLKKFYRYNFAFFQTPQIGIYRVMPRTLKRVTAFQAGAALAAHVATTAAEALLKDHELSPRVDPERCRGCGRCVDICPFDAVRLVPNDRGFYTAEVLHYNCVGCGGCVSRCPVTAMDIPYFSNRLLEEIVACTMAEDD
ncbi:MAG: FAD-dependent oxidoreductase [Deltaproteobacteria bacterium]|nr:FAD-dependent oxidoreductase [Deltaproteobacteria bacterium]